MSIVYIALASRLHAQTPAVPELIPQDKEMVIALNAAPERLRSGAPVYVLRENGFVLVRKGTNGFTCIINRDHPLNQKPTCYDAEGSETILPQVLRFGELLMKGVPPEAINTPHPTGH